MKRFGMVIGVRAGRLEEYKRPHAAVWPDVLKKTKQCPIRNASIHLRQLDDGQHPLSGCFEYTGLDVSADMEKMAADEATKRWWAACKPCQKPLNSRAGEGWWSCLEEIFHLG